MTKHPLALASLVSFALLLQGCASVGITRLKDGKARDESCALDVYVNASEIKRPYESICQIDSRTGTTAFHDRTAAAAIAQAKPAACECGADAIVIGGMDTEGMSLTGWGMGKSVITGIRYTDK